MKATPPLISLQRTPLNYRDDAGEPIPHPTPVWKRLRCRAARIPYLYAGADILKPMCAHYAGQAAPSVNGIRICPHRGAPLSSLAPDIDGCVTCPLHGLRFDTRTWRALKP